jgi:hypothetical protein
MKTKVNSHITLKITHDGIEAEHCVSIDDVATFVHRLADFFEKDEDLLIILDRAIRLYRINHQNDEYE